MNFKIKLGIFLLVIGLIGGIFMIVEEVVANYNYDKEYSSYWNLADKASTIQQKSEYIQEFTQRLESSGLEGEYNAVFLKTPDNSFDKNLEALKSLQTRLQNISTLDENSFAYQTAIQQITAQEQGEAQEMLSVFKGCWYKHNYIYLWEWIWGIFIVFLITLITGGIILWGIGHEERKYRL